MLSEKAKQVIRVAMANKQEAAELIAELDKISGAGAVAIISTVDAVDAATTQAMANECKAKINELIAALA